MITGAGSGGVPRGAAGLIATRAVIGPSAEPPREAPDVLPGPILRRVFLLPNALYRHRLGWLLGRRFLQVSHRGRRSGRLHHTVLEVVRRDRATGAVTVVAGFGARADWLRNLQAAPAESVTTGRSTFVPRQRFLTPEEGAEVLRHYERRNRLAAPLIRWVLGRLAGFRYDGSATGRRRAAEVLPMVEFRR